MSDIIMDWRKVVLMLTFALVSVVVGHHFRSAAQRSPALYELMLAADLHTFLTSGGEPVGYDNYFKWTYAIWLADPRTSRLAKVLFWRAGFLYDASSPPAEYRYPPHFQTNRLPWGLPRGFFIFPVLQYF
ncbi:MAG: hypothetical protein WC451_02930 [Patescibacteria group bacterium]|jgi:hypothetical protein